MMRSKSWLESHGLQLAMHKVELFLPTRRHIPLEVEIKIGDVTIPMKYSITYLGSKLSYSKQIEYAMAGAARITTKLSRQVANIRGPIASRRKLLIEAGNKYHTPLWI